jgi:hypothetical protein
MTPKDEIAALDATIPDLLHPVRKKDAERALVDSDKSLSAKERTRRKAVIDNDRPHVWADKDGALASHYDDDHTIPVFMDGKP